MNNLANMVESAEWQTQEQEKKSTKQYHFLMKAKIFSFQAYKKSYDAVEKVGAGGDEKRTSVLTSRDRMQCQDVWVGERKGQADR